MYQEQKAILLLASRLLSYPEEAYLEEEADVDAFVWGYIESDEIRAELKSAYAPLLRIPLQVREQLYVATFDLKSKTGLYLTAHELGDSPKRGAALLKLKYMMHQAGFEHVEGELADYIPLLFEFLAVSDEMEEHTRLERRLAVALKMMNGHIQENSYASILQVLIKYVFPEPEKQEMDRLKFEREEADLEDLPYPIMYQ